MKKRMPVKTVYAAALIFLLSFLVVPHGVASDYHVINPSVSGTLSRQTDPSFPYYVGSPYSLNTSTIYVGEYPGHLRGFFKFDLSAYSPSTPLRNATLHILTTNVFSSDFTTHWWQNITLAIISNIGNSVDSTDWDKAISQNLTTLERHPHDLLGGFSNNSAIDITSLVKSNFGGSISFRVAYYNEPYAGGDMNKFLESPVWLELNYAIVGTKGAFNVNGSQVTYAIRLQYNATSTYLNSKAVSWKTYSNNTQYDSGTATTNSTGWLNFRAANNLPYRNGTWELWVSDGINETTDNQISAFYYIKTSNFNVSYWPATRDINHAFDFNVTFSSNCAINSTAINLNNVYITVEAWWYGSVYINKWTYNKFTAADGSNMHSEEFINNIPIGNNTVRVRLYYYDNISSHILSSQNKTFIVTGPGGPGETNQGTGSGSQPPIPSPSPSYAQQIAETVVTNPLAQTGLIALTALIVGAFVFSRARQHAPSSRDVQRKLQKYLKG